jgi:hypothetical protein
MSRHVARWLGLAATPTFAAMAVVTGLSEARAGTLLCGAAPSLLGGMALMYALMGAFHLGPWLRLVSERRLSPH